MGNTCLQSLCTRCHEDDSLETQPFSWEQRPRVDMSQFTVDGEAGGVVWRRHGELAGQPFIVQNCRALLVCLLDHVNALTVDECCDCTFIVGAVTGSVFMRDCRRCRVVVACGQFRSRDCQHMDVMLLCCTQPIIEATTSLRLACYQLNYPGLSEHLSSAGLSVFNNWWSRVHDFTPLQPSSPTDGATGGGAANWSVATSRATSDGALFSLPAPVQQQLSECAVSVCCDRSPVPCSAGRVLSHVPGSSHTLVLLTDYEPCKQTGVTWLHADIVRRQPEALLMFSRELRLSKHQLVSLLEGSCGSLLPRRRSVNHLCVGLVYAGVDLAHHCVQARLAASCEQLLAADSVHVLAGSTGAASSFYSFSQTAM